MSFFESIANIFSPPPVKIGQQLGSVVGASQSNAFGIKAPAPKEIPAPPSEDEVRAQQMAKAFDPSTDVWSPNDDQYKTVTEFVPVERFPQWAILLGAAAAAYYLFRSK